MGRRRCCCEECWEAEEDFDDPIKVVCGSIPADWNVCIGTWSLQNYTPLGGLDCVLEAATAGTIAWKQSPGTETRVGLIEFDLRPNLSSGSPLAALEDGQHVRVYAFKDSSCSGDWIAADLYIEDVSGSIKATLNLLDSGGTLQTSGVETVPVGAGTTISFCVGEDACGAMLSDSTYPIRACHDKEFTDPYFVISNESSSKKATFDNFWQSDHYDSDILCPACYCSCDGRCVPLTLCMTLNNDDAATAYQNGYDGCEEVDDLPIELTRNLPCTWQSASYTCPPSDSVPLGSRDNGSWELIPAYGSGISGDLTVSDYILQWNAAGGGSSAQFTPNGNSTCDPFYLEYDATVFSDTYNNRCCEGHEYLSDPGTCPDGSSPQEVGADPENPDAWFCPGYYFITITECPESNGGGIGDEPISGGSVSG